MSIDKLLAEIEERRSFNNGWIISVDAVKDIIRKHTEGMVLVPEDEYNQLQKESLEINKSDIYYALLDASAAFAHCIEFTAKQYAPDRLLTAEDVRLRDLGWIERMKTNFMFRRVVENFAHVQLDNIRKALIPQSERDKALDDAMSTLMLQASKEV